MAPQTGPKSSFTTKTVAKNSKVMRNTLIKNTTRAKPESQFIKQS